MLYESDVIAAVCAEMEKHGYRITEKRTTRQRGDDIVAMRQSDGITREVRIEAKGQTSSREGSYRYGEQFESAQVRVHVAEAVFKAAQVLSRRTEDREVKVGVALPYDYDHRKMVISIEPILQQLGISVFWVKDSGDVEIQAAWEL